MCVEPGHTRSLRLSHTICIAIIFVGWGDFEALSLACIPYAAINPRTGSAMVIPAALLLGFNAPPAIVRCTAVLFGLMSSFIK